MLFTDAEMEQLGITAFDEILNDEPVHEGDRLNDYVACITQALIDVLPDHYRSEWEFAVFEDDSANAFALPGGKIGVYTGMLSVARNQDQLAAVIGHEIGHVIANHSAEQLSMEFMAASAEELLGEIIAGSAEGELVMGALGLGAEYGLLLPWSRTQEAESDVIGQQLMAKAGFDPRASVTLWQNMAAAEEGPEPPEFLSTHPSHQTRIDGLQNLVAENLLVYQQARADGNRPRCD